MMSQKNNQLQTFSTFIIILQLIISFYLFS